MNLIDYHDSRPIYEQIVENFKLQILKGILRADEQMPSVRSLAIELSTNPNTVQKAYAELERQGYIYTIKGRGNFVKGNTSMIDNKKREIIDAIVELFREAEDIGFSLEEILDEIKNEFKKLDKSIGAGVSLGVDENRGGKA
ncbi:MAG: GntR family transcriptional regulator [Butyrivibrio sp.]|nr:GntR family transcriptional regulator [Butyrivibrio sp.]